MSSPPSLDSLKISGEESSTKTAASEPSSSTSPAPASVPSPAAEAKDGKPTAPNGQAKASDSAQTPGTSSNPQSQPHPQPQLQRPAPTHPTQRAPPTSRPSPGNVPQRPSPNLPAASAPSIPGRPGVGGPMRGGMQGPMGMGMRGRGGPSRGAPALPPSLQAKMDAVAQRSGASSPGTSSGGAPNPNATSMGALLRSQALGQQQGRGAAGPGSGGPSGGSGSGGPQLPGPASGPLGLAARRAAGNRPNLSQLGGGPPPASAPGGLASRRGPPGGLNLSAMQGQAPGTERPESNRFTDYSQIMDPSGSLRFSSRAVLTANGVDFEDGASFKINMDEMDIVGELGKGNYGSVQQVFHRPTGVMMAMKEIRLELDESKLNGIIMELDILHRAVAPEIVEFFGAFTIESCVYYCMELMDAGSLDTLTGGGVPANQIKEGDEVPELRVPEPVLRRITASMVRGLKFLKDELQIMHRDVKPTNVLINKKGEVKLVDFGVSGQLEKSLAKTNIGCQSYMAPERIKGESQGQSSSYTVSSDVWSVGLSIIELAKGCYPYPPETFANVFAQLTAIVHGPPPTLPAGYSADAHDFVAKCLIKEASARPTYAQLLEHPFLASDKDTEVDMAGWVAGALEKRAARGIIPLQPIEA